MPQLKRSEVLIAVIGLVGVLATGVLSNWDKLFPKHGVVTATYSGYRPTGDFETELRYYFEVSGTRLALESMQQQFLQQMRTNQISQHPSDAEEINKAFDIIANELLKLDDIIKALLPIYQKHFTINEIQELNKFYSTDVMQDMRKKVPLISQDAAPTQVRLMNDYMERITKRLEEAFPPANQAKQPTTSPTPNEKK